jgi:hypothetical protein
MSNALTIHEKNQIKFNKNKKTIEDKLAVLKAKDEKNEKEKKKSM